MVDYSDNKNKEFIEHFSFCGETIEAKRTGGIEVFPNTKETVIKLCNEMEQQVMQYSKTPKKLSLRINFLKIFIGAGLIGTVINLFMYYNISPNVIANFLLMIFIKIANLAFTLNCIHFLKKTITLLNLIAIDYEKYKFFIENKENIVNGYDFAGDVSLTINDIEFIEKSELEDIAKMGEEKNKCLLLTNN